MNGVAGLVLTANDNTPDPVNDAWGGIAFANRAAGTSDLRMAQISSGAPGVSSGDIRFYTSNTTSNTGTFGEKVRITSTGNVGIGTTSPGAKFTVVDASPAGAASIRLWSGATGSYAAYSLGRTSDEGYLGIAAVSGNYITGSAAGDVILRSNNANLHFGTNSTTNVMTLSGSNVGIGTTSPSDLGSGATIGPVLQIGASTTGGQLSLTSGDLTVGENVGDVSFGSSGTSNAEKRTAMILSTIETTFGSTAVPIGNLRFFTNDGTSIAERVRISTWKFMNQSAEQ